MINQRHDSEELIVDTKSILRVTTQYFLFLNSQAPHYITRLYNRLFDYPSLIYGFWSPFNFFVEQNFIRHIQTKKYIFSWYLYLSLWLYNQLLLWISLNYVGLSILINSDYLSLDDIFWKPFNSFVDQKFKTTMQTKENFILHF